METEDTTEGPDASSRPTGNQEQRNHTRDWRKGPSVLSEKDLNNLNNLLQDIVLKAKQNGELDGSGDNTRGEMNADNMRQYDQNRNTGFTNRYGNMGQNNGNMGYDTRPNRQSENMGYNNMGSSQNGNMGFGGMGQNNNNAQFGNMHPGMFSGENRSSSGLHSMTQFSSPYHLNVVHTDDKNTLERMNRVFQGEFPPPPSHDPEWREQEPPESFENYPRSADPYEEPPDDGFMFMDPVLNGVTEDEMTNPCPGMKFQHLSNFIIEKPLVLVSREQWGAQAPRRITPLKHPIQNIVITFKSMAAPCYNKEDCSDRMRQLQRYHMQQENLSDLPYNFLVGHDGTVYEGRGWDAHSSAALNYFPELKGDRIDIAFIGDYRRVLYPLETSNAIMDLIQLGCDNGKVNFYYDMNEYREGIPEE